MPLGDPAVLIASSLGIQKSGEPRFTLGVVPHYTDKNHPFVAALARQDGTVVLDVCKAPDAFLAMLQDCQAIVSTSLHGLVFADALRIPSLWMELSDNVAGGGFKFHDWFSTSSNPQRESFRPRSIGDLAYLAGRCEPRTPEIDVDELASAFPARAFEAAPAMKERATHLVPVGECRRRPIPIFVISYNRAGYLRRVIASFQRQSEPCEIVIHDNGSDDPETVAMLAELERTGVKVYRHAKIVHPDELNDVDESIHDFFSAWSEPSDYIVTDCDIDLSVTDVRAIEVYRELLTIFRKASCVGPMLRIRDIPPRYPLFNHVMNRHINRLWQREPSFAETSHGTVAYLEATFDTVFAVHRAGERFHRKKKGLRVYEPYEALHLDWYAVDQDETVYQQTLSEGVAHWSNRREFARFEDEPLRFDAFKVVRQNPDGSLTVTAHPVPGIVLRKERRRPRAKVRARPLREWRSFMKQDRERRDST
jgi:hypothetical protein